MMSDIEKNVESRILQSMEDLTQSERAVASLLLDDYPVSGLLTITKIADKAGVSTPSVVRMAKKIGYSGFSDMQQAMQADVSASIQDPIKKRNALATKKNKAHITTRFSEAINDNLRHTLNRLDYDAFDAVAHLLANSDKTVYLAGGRITRSVADYLFNHLQIIRPNIIDMGTSANIWPQFIVDMNENAVLLVFDIRRYESHLTKLAKLSQDKGASVVLFTDQWGSPISQLSDYKFQSHVDVPSPWDSSIAIMILVESMISAVQDLCWKDGKTRIEELEKLFGKTHPFDSFD